MKAKPRQIAAGTAGKLMALRRELGFTKQQMAESLGLTYDGYSKYERGESIPGLHTLNIIVNKYRLSVDWLIFDREPKYIEDRSRSMEIEKEVEQLKASLDSQRLDFESRLGEENKKNETLKRQLEQSAAVPPDVFKKSGIADLLNMVEKSPEFYYKLMLYVEDYKKREKGEGKS